MTDNFGAGFIVGVVTVLLVGGIWGALHCSKFGFFMYCS